MVNWLDRPIRHGDPFVPLAACRIVPGKQAWLLRPTSAGRGIWTRVPTGVTNAAGLTLPRRVPWYEFERIEWEVGDGYRLRIRLGDSPGILTGPVEIVDGDFR